MIVTLTANPSLDRTLAVSRLERGAVLRSGGRLVEPGGKGINVARALHRHGHAVRPVLPCGGAEGAHLLALLQDAGLSPATVAISGAVRANITLVEPDGTTTKINEPGPLLSPDELERLVATAVTAADGASWLVASGSLPPGAPDDLLAELTRRVRAAGCRVAIDSSGRPLLAAILACPDLVKPNLDELTEVAGRPLHTLGDVVAAAEELLAVGVGAVLASLGRAGAVLVDRHGCLHAGLPVNEPRSSVGAGDASLAGYLSAVENGRASALTTAVAFGAAAVSLPGSQMPGPGDVRPDQVLLTEDIQLAGELDRSEARAGLAT